MNKDQRIKNKMCTMCGNKNFELSKKYYKLHALNIETRKACTMCGNILTKLLKIPLASDIRCNNIGLDGEVKGVIM